MEQAAINIIQPVIEEAFLLAGSYCKNAGRDTLLAKDLEYCLKYCAMKRVGVKLGSYFPDIYSSSESESDQDDIDIVDEEDLLFTEYCGPDELMNNINLAYKEWDNWMPTNPAEQMLKNAIDNNDY